MKAELAQVVSCCVYDKPPKIIQYMHLNIPHLLDFWADLYVHLSSTKELHGSIFLLCKIFRFVESLLNPGKNEFKLIFCFSFCSWLIGGAKWATQIVWAQKDKENKTKKFDKKLQNLGKINFLKSEPQIVTLKVKDWDLIS